MGKCKLVVRQMELSVTQLAVAVSIW